MFDGMEGWIVSAFLAAGGGALVWGMGKKHVPKIIDKGFEKLLAVPRFRQFVRDNADAISEIIDKAEDLLLEDIKQIKEEQDPPAPAKAPGDAGSDASQNS